MSDIDEQLKHNRRVGDMGAERLADMLEQENDARTRALLLVLSSLNSNLVANTAATESIRTDLTAHLASYHAHMTITTEYINKGKGAWKVVAWVLGLAQAILVLTMGSIHTDMKAFAASVVSLQIADSQLEAKIYSNGVKPP